MSEAAPTGVGDGLPDDVRGEALDAVLAVLDQIPGRKGDWMNVKYASAAIDAMLPAIRRHIADHLRGLRPGLPQHPSREQESFQKGYDTAVAQLDRMAARGGETDG